MVNHHFNRIVSSLLVWTQMFPLIFGDNTRLRTLVNIPDSKSYMLYICANSLYICEECLGLTDNSSLYYRPQPALAPMPTMTKGDLIYLGEEVNKTWKIWMCSPCRQKQEASQTSREDSGDQKTRERIR
ncbi:hypothetical protein BGZ72_000151, partial [Mortierella alpina]